MRKGISKEELQKQFTEMKNNGASTSDIMVALDLSYAECKKLEAGNEVPQAITFYNKLVRDNIPAIIEKSGKKANYRVLENNEHTQALKDKLVEEVTEFLQAVKLPHMIEELGDIATVMLSLMDNLGISVDTIVDVANKKVEEKGAFSERYFLESVEDGGKND